MAEYVEEEFGRLLPETRSEDVAMPDVPYTRGGSADPDQTRPNGIVHPYEDLAMSPRSQSQPIQSVEQDPQRLELPKFIIAVDFGTTFSSVAFVRIEPDTPARLVESHSIRCVDNYPDMPPGGSAPVFASNPTVPTELLCYRKKSKRSDEDPLHSDSSDHESDCTLDADWVSSATEDSDGEQEIPQPESGKPANMKSIWGWGVHSRLVKPDSIPADLQHLKNFKLLLDKSSATQSLRDKSKEEMKTLKAVKEVDIIADYLGHLLKHAKARLIILHGLRNDSPVEFVLCVPTSWTDKACRDMQKALTAAIQASQLAQLDQGIVEDLFIVAESEAAAAYALDSAEVALEMTVDESFLVMDCGGGTIDAITYTLTQTAPNRLREVVKSEGVSCGSSFLNQDYEKLLNDRLKHATIVGNDLPLERIIAAKVQAFENEKRVINILDKKTHFDPVFIQGLQADSQHGFRKNKLDLTWKEMYEVFKPRIVGVSDLMRSQLNAAKGQRVNVGTVILIGGFGESPSLYNHLKKVLRRERNLLNQSIDLVRPRYTESAVARGAVLRALRKEDGPERITRTSYGILRTDRWNGLDRNHRRFHVWRDPADGEIYIKNAIHWVLDKVRWSYSAYGHPCTAIANQMH